MEKSICRVFPVRGLVTLVEQLMQKHPVMGPRERADQPGFYKFDWLETPEDFIPEYTTTTLPPKKAFFPPEQTLFRFQSGLPPEFRMIRENFPFVLAGVHPCDLAALDMLDRAYGHPPAESLWHENRRRAVVIAMDCMPDDYCFCTSVGTCDERFPCDLFLTNIGDEYLAEIYSSKGQQILTGVRTRGVRERDLKKAEQQRRLKKEAVSARFNSPVARLAGILEKGGLTDVWKQIAEHCYSCGSCNITCPTCFCFNMHDTFDFTLQGGTRHRSWDSCQLLEFALIAGGENMRAERWQRVRHRWYRKFLYLYRQFGRPYCTGCGRCSRACTADINMVDVTNGLIDGARSEAAGV